MVSGYVEISTDITRRKKTEEALRLSEERLTLAMHAANEGLWDFNPQSREIYYLSPRWSTMLGYEPGELKPTMEIFFKLLHPDDCERMRQALETGIHAEDNLRMEYRLRAKGGEYRWILSRASTVERDNQKRSIRVVGTHIDISEIKKVEEALRESQDKFRLLVENQTDLVIKLNQNGEFVFVSPSYGRFFGKAEQELIGQPYFPAIHEEDRESARQVIHQIYEPPHVVYDELRTLSKDGWRWLGWAYSAVLDQDQQVTEIIGVGRDITQQKIAEEASRQSATLLRQIIDLIPHIIYACNERGEFILANQTMAAAFGLEVDDVIGRTCPAIAVSHPYLADLVKHDAEVIATGLPLLNAEEELIDVHQMQRILQTMKIPFVVADSTDKAILSIGIDITLRKQIERELTRAHQIYRESIENAQGVPYQFNYQTQTYEFVGESALTLLGIAPQELTIAKMISIIREVVIPGPEEYHDEVEYSRDFQNGKINKFQADYCITTPSGEKWISDFAIPIHDEKSGAVVGSIGILQDITQRKLAEKMQSQITTQLRQQKKLESIGTLAAGVAHEINNPLTGIINYAQLIHNRVSDTTLKEFALGIIEEGERVAKIVRNLLAFARQDKESYSPFSLREITDAALTLIGTVLRKDQITIQVAIPDDLPMVICHGQQIEQVIINLLTNARNALNQRYEGYHDDKLIVISGALIHENDQKWLRITVEDHGTGIPHEIIENIFDPFFTTKSRSEGTGLGLSVSYGIMKEHNGRLLVESKVNQYTRFHIDLPLPVE